MDCSSKTFFDEPCELCPRRCGVRRALGQRGICAASDKIEVARAALHLWEEPPISGESGSGTVFFTHCSLRCRYCQNFEISHQGRGQTMTVSELTDRMLGLAGEGALNINLVTATHYAPAVRAAVREAREQGLSLPIVWNTSGYESVETLRELRDVVDVYLCDYKYASEDAARRLSAAPDYPMVALAALDEMVAQQPEMRFDEYRGEERLVGGVIVRHLVLPGAVKEACDVVRIIDERYGDAVRLSLMNQYTPLESCKASLPEALRWPLDPAEYEAVLTFADDLGLADYFWQQEDACGEVYIPTW